MSDGAFRLQGLRLKRVSLVSEPAQAPAQVVLFKSADKPAAKPAVKAVKKDDATDMDTVTCSKCNKSVAPKADGTCPNCGAKLTGAKSMSKAIDLDKITDPEVKKAVEKMAADLEAALALAKEAEDSRVAAEKTAKGKETEEDLMKGLPPAQKALLEKAIADAKLANDAIKKMGDEKRELEFVAKAKSYGNLSLDPKVFGLVLKRVADGTSTEADVVELHRVLIAANKVAKGLFVQKGASGAGAAAGTDAMAQITAKAKELREEVLKSGEKLSHPDALDRVIRENPEIYKQYLAENGPAPRAAASGAQEEE